MIVGPLRVQTDWFEGDEARTSRSYGFNLPATEVPDHLAALVDETLVDLRAIGCDDPIGFMLTELMTQLADVGPYQREAARRGLLPL